MLTSPAVAMLLHPPNHCAREQLTAAAMPLLTAGHPPHSWRKLLETQLCPNWWQEKDRVTHTSVLFSRENAFTSLVAEHVPLVRVPRGGAEMLLWDAMGMCLGRRQFYL